MVTSHAWGLEDGSLDCRVLTSYFRNTVLTEHIEHLGMGLISEGGGNTRTIWLISTLINVKQSSFTRDIKA